MGKSSGVSSWYGIMVFFVSFNYVVLYGVNEDFYNAYYWFFADGLSNAREQYETGNF